MAFLVKATLGLVLSLSLMLSPVGCVNAVDTVDQIREQMGVDVGGLEHVETWYLDDRPFSDNATVDVFECDGGAFRQIEADWRPLPLPEGLGGWVPSDPDLPRFEHGHYLCSDRDDDGLSLLIYDADGERLYYYESAT